MAVQRNKDVLAAPDAALAALITSSAPVFNSVNVATALRRVVGARGGGADLSRACALLLDRAHCVLESEPLNARTLSAIAHSAGRLGGALVGGHPRFVLALCGCLQRGAGGLDAQGVANSLWALATLHDPLLAAAAGQVDGAVLSRTVAALCAVAVPLSGRMGCQEAANTAWALATLRARDGELLRALATAVTSRLRTSPGDFTPQGLSMVAWAFAKLRHTDNPLLLAISKTATARLTGERSAFDPQSLVNLLWAFSALGRTEPALTSAVCASARVLLGSFTSQGTSGLLWALQQQAAHVGDGGEGGPGSSSAPSTETGAESHLSSFLPLLTARVRDAIPSMGGQECGLLAWSLTHGTCGVGQDAAEGPCTLCALRARAVSVACDMTWRSIAHVELASRVAPHNGKCSTAVVRGSTQSGRKRRRAEEEPAVVPVEEGVVLQALGTRLAALLPSMAEECESRNGQADALLRSTLKAGFRGRDTSSLPPPFRPPAQPPSRESPRGVLLVGADASGKTARCLRKYGGCSVQHWHRFVGEGVGSDASVWPEWDASSCSASACVLRYPSACVLRYPSAGLDAFSMALHAVAGLLQPCAPLVVAGNTDEGCTLAAVSSACAGLFHHVAQAASSPDGGSLVLLATRVEGTPSHHRRTLEAWGKRATVALYGSTLPAWVSFPGLFAGGGLDVMTAALLSILPPPPRRKARVLDFACGSGCIAAAVRARDPTTRLYMLDADAVALRAAGVNVPGATAVLSDRLGDGAEGGEVGGDTCPRPLRRGSHKLDWIVSNPPVHAGQPDDFRVILALAAGAPSRLAPGGVLWIVSQEQVPVGRLLTLGAGDAAFASVQALRPAGGRFVVWRAAVAAGEDESK